MCERVCTTHEDAFHDDSWRLSMQTCMPPPTVCVDRDTTDRMDAKILFSDKEDRVVHVHSAPYRHRLD